MTMFNDKKKYIYFTGDFFWSENDSNDVISLIKNAFTDGDVILNAEGSLKPAETIKVTTPKKAVSLSFNKKIINLAALPYCFLSIVNNHASDCGKHAFEDFRKLLKRKALASFSTDIDPRRKVKDINLLFFADEREECRCKKYNFLRFDKSVILKSKKYINKSYIIVHGGIEYRKNPTVYQRYLSHLLIELGANAVIFHHSHILGNHEWLNGKLIHYGLGNFYFSSISNLHGIDNIEGIILRVHSTGEVDASKVNIIKKKVSMSLNFESLNKNECIAVNIQEYKRWYKNVYPLDSSLRPRQLSQNETVNRIQFYAWYTVASLLMKIRLTKKLKALFNYLGFIKAKNRSSR